MSRWISHNLSLFAISLLLAFFFWAVATEAEDPTRIDTFGGPITIELRGLQDGMTTYGSENATARVEIRAPRSVWDQLRAEDIDAYVDLTSVGTGTVEVPIQVELESGPADITGITPERIELVIEPVAEKEVPVQVVIQGTPAIGFSVENPEIAPQSVRVVGPESLVEQVNRVQVAVSVEGRQGSVRSDYQPLAVDEDGASVENVETAPRSVTVNVPVTQLGFFRDIPVTAGPLVGQPAPGYRISNLEFVPPAVKVSGRREVVQGVNFLQTEPINLQGITQTLTTSVTLQMVQGLSVIQPSQPVVTVTVTVEIIRSGITLEITPTIRALSPALTASVGPESVVVILSGPLDIMESLQPSDVQVILDLSGLGTGEYTIVPMIVVPDQVDVENVIPEAVPIQIDARAQPQETPNSR